MTLTKQQLQKMVDTFTISYYLGHNIEVVDVNNGNSAYTSGNADIHIGLGIINQALASLDENASEELVRNTVRSIFYHELGHILLTPAKLLIEMERNLGYEDYFQKELDKIKEQFEAKEGETQ